MTDCTCDPLAIALAKQVHAPQTHGAQCPSSPPATFEGPTIALNDDAALKSIIQGAFEARSAEARGIEGVEAVTSVLNNF